MNPLLFMLFTSMLTFGHYDCRADVLRIRIPSAIDSLDWGHSTTSLSNMLHHNIMEGLFELDSTGRPVPQLAMDHQLSADQKRLVIHLKPGILWSDGSPLVADDFISEWLRVIDPLEKSGYANFFKDVQGAAEYASGSVRNPATVGFTAPNESTIIIRFRRPSPAFVALLTDKSTFPARRNTLNKRPFETLNARNIPVLGPFKIKQAEPTLIVLERNTRYHGTAPAITGIEIQVITNDAESIRLFRAGKLDFIHTVDWREASNLRGSASHISVPKLHTAYLSLSATKYPLNLLIVRKALKAAIDRTRLVKTMPLAVEAAASFIPESLLKCPPPENNPDAGVTAKELLARSGLDHTKLKLSVATAGDDTSSLMLEELRKQLQRTLGLELEILSVSQKDYSTRLALKNDHLLFQGWWADYPDPANFLEVYRSGSQVNFTGWSSPEYDRAVDLGEQEQDQAKRIRYFCDAANILENTESVVIPIYYGNSDFLLNPKYIGFDRSPIMSFRFRQLRLK